jgi:hypothetical protein
MYLVYVYSWYLLWSCLIWIFFFVYSGTYDIFVDNKLVGKYDSSGSFGELALMYNMPRAATIVATSEGSLWAMVCYFLILDNHERNVRVLYSVLTTAWLNVLLLKDYKVLILCWCAVLV